MSHIEERKEIKKKQGKVANIVLTTNIVLFILLIAFCVAYAKYTLDTVDTAISNSSYNDMFSDKLPENENSYRFGSEISDYVCNYTVPEGFDVIYSDDYAVEFVEHYDNLSEEEEQNYELYKSHYYSSFMSVRNTPYVSSNAFMKASLMNQGFDNIYDFTQDGKYYIVAWTSLNEDSDEEHAYHTAINVLCTIDTNVDCPYKEDCQHTDYLQQYVSTSDKLDNEGVTSLVTYIIGEYEVGK